MEDRTGMYEAFGAKLEQELLQLCVSKGLLKDKLLSTPDIEEKWDRILGREFCIDAVREFNEYPEATLSWAAYLGMAVAFQWDRDWVRYMNADYKSYYGSKGFDDMDEHIVRDILKYPLNSDKAARLADDLQACACCTLSLIRHEGIEYQSTDAYYIMVKSVSVLYRIGEAIALDLLGYKYVPVSEIGNR